jgi:hypothetical protein
MKSRVPDRAEGFRAEIEGFLPRLVGNLRNLVIVMRPNRSNWPARLCGPFLLLGYAATP